jgi:hypothetical protein
VVSHGRHHHNRLSVASEPWSSGLNARAGSPQNRHSGPPSAGLDPPRGAGRGGVHPLQPGRDDAAPPWRPGGPASTAPPPVPAHLRAPVAGPGWRRDRPHAHRRLEVPCHAPALRRLGCRRSRPRGPPSPLPGGPAVVGQDPMRRVEPSCGTCLNDLGRWRTRIRWTTPRTSTRGHAERHGAKGGLGDRRGPTGAACGDRTQLGRGE